MVLIVKLFCVSFIDMNILIKNILILSNDYYLTLCRLLNLGNRDTYSRLQ